MDNMAYLQQISSTSKPKTGAGGKFKFNPLWLIPVGVIIVVMIFVGVISSMLGGVQDKEKDLTFQASARAQALVQIIRTNNTYVKSSDLRTMATSLSTVLTDTDRDLVAVLRSDFNYDSVNKETLPFMAEETELITNLEVSLTDAQLNGILDRVYVRELNLQIALLLSIESEALARTERPALQEVLTKSINSLQNLQTQFTEYTDLSN